jgi:hypothetical protein
MLLSKATLKALLAEAEWQTACLENAKVLGSTDAGWDEWAVRNAADLPKEVVRSPQKRLGIYKGSPTAPTEAEEHAPADTAPAPSPTLLTTPVRLPKAAIIPSELAAALNSGTKVVTASGSNSGGDELLVPAEAFDGSFEIHCLTVEKQTVVQALDEAKEKVRGLEVELERAIEAANEQQVRSDMVQRCFCRSRKTHAFAWR